eukprot:c20616_g1_i4.p1 GENE.c20616_g1_i4~~c20616_g1_i4.p1  ORF type:complete len:114 (-),score=23.78 c20616_g1_i4:744-1085(-)
MCSGVEALNELRRTIEIRVKSLILPSNKHNNDTRSPSPFVVVQVECLLLFVCLFCFVVSVCLLQFLLVWKGPIVGLVCLQSILVNEHNRHFGRRQDFLCHLGQANNERHGGCL